MLNAEWGLMIWTLITFAISAFVLYRLAFKPLQKVIDDRRVRIQESLETAQVTRDEAAKLLEEYKQTLADVRSEAEEIVERARRAGEGTKEEIVVEARRQADLTLARAHDQIERDTRAAVRQLRDQVADLTARAAEKIIARSLDDTEHARLIDEALRETNLDDLVAGGGFGGSGKSA
jgi:F-type H+-transporting ATPase subunit b